MFSISKDVPFYDTNMHRVLHRVFFGPAVPAAAARPKEVMDLAAGLVPPGRGWAWNQAVMEFGALRCTARRPACGDCPLRDLCKARPKMHEALARVPRAAKNGPALEYRETNVYLRGRVLARLREVPDPGGVGLRELGRQLRGDAAEVRSLRLKEVVESLERAGLARVTRPSERSEAPPAGAVAEGVQLRVLLVDGRGIGEEQGEGYTVPAGGGGVVGVDLPDKLRGVPGDAQAAWGRRLGVGFGLRHFFRDVEPEPAVEGGRGPRIAGHDADEVLSHV